MEWPYDHPRRGDMPSNDHALTLNEYTIRKPPYAKGPRYQHVFSYVQGWSGTDYQKHRRRREGPSLHRHQLRLGPRTNFRRKNDHLGPFALRLSDYDFKAASRDGFGENWPISYSDIEPYYDRVDNYLGISGLKENLRIFPTAFSAAQ